MDQGSGVTRGGRRRNAQMARLRAMVPAGNTVAGVDLGERRQALVVTGTDGRVLARR
jgi:transposase